MNRRIEPRDPMGVLSVGFLALLFAASIAAALLVTPAHTATAAVDPEILATRIAESLKNGGLAKRYKSVAISRIRQAGGKYNIKDLIDFTNVKIVRGRRFRVIDRSKLELILKEQKVLLQDFVSAQKYQELGKLMGVDLFIYGTFYRDALVLKGIDVQNSAIVWAEFFPTKKNPREAVFLNSLGNAMIESLRKDLPRLKKANIRLISFWGLDAGKYFSSRSVMDYLSVALTKDQSFKVVDRENLRLITGEQKLNQEVFIDQKNAKRLGELYGVDGFIYGSIKKRKDGTFLASMKIMNILNGVIEWADLIRIGPKAKSTAANKALGAVRREGGMVFIPSGVFRRGANDGPSISAPMHRVDLPAFHIDETEVSNVQYEKFVRERKYRPPVGWKGGRYPSRLRDHPVVGITWGDARQYCAYVGKRLPAESEWEKAARGPNGAKFPWGGKTFSPGFTNTRESGHKSSMPVNSSTRDLSVYKIKHLSGNVREWVADTLASYRKSGGSGSGRGKDLKKVVRGGSWATDYRSTPAYFRGSSNPSLAWPDVGFRCAKSG